MKVLAVGYFLSAFNALALTPLGLYLFFPALVTYPVSIVLRGLGWRRLRERLGSLGSLYMALWTLGPVTYISILLSFFGEVRPLIYLATATWAFYSILEATLYVTAAKNFTKVFLLSPISLVGVALVTISVVNATLPPVSKDSTTRGGTRRRGIKKRGITDVS
ncbi:MAG: hypothetical protein ACK4SY_05420 [Pyrobaculum sp.]